MNLTHFGCLKCKSYVKLCYLFQSNSLVLKKRFSMFDCYVMLHFFYTACSIHEWTIPENHTPKKLYKWPNSIFKKDLPWLRSRTFRIPLPVAWSLPMNRRQLDAFPVIHALSDTTKTEPKRTTKHNISDQNS